MKEPRAIAYNLINEWETKQTFPNLSLKNSLRTVENERDRRFITALVYGVIEKKITLDYFIAQCSNRSLESIKPSVLSALRLGVYQMFYMDTPASAACNTTVELVKRNGMVHSAGFVNAVLRQCARRKDTLLLLKKTDFSVRYSIAPELVDLILNQYGKEIFISIMESLNEPDTAVYLFHNAKRGGEHEFITGMLNEGIALEKTGLSHLFKVQSGFSIESSLLYKEGWFHVVGLHSAETALLMPSTARKVMDLCAAPGGKTFILSALTAGVVHAYDLYPHKIENLEQTACRLHHENVILSVADSTITLESHDNSADFVLCDVPCSGLGMIGKKPDIKYKKYSNASFNETQFSILTNGARYLKEGGTLVYSTCTIDKRENEYQIERFLKRNPNFELIQQKTFLPSSSGDGFYFAELKKGHFIEN